MKFISTRGKDFAENASYAISKGMAEDGGLFVPETFPDLSKDLSKLLEMNYSDRASFILSKYLDEYDFNELSLACKNAYSKFEDEDVAPVVKIDDNLFVLELFHGPTLAFKDVALTLLPFLLRKGSDNCGVKDEILILVATSGDTGKAALEGFKNQKGIKIMVFFPSEGVSDMQKAQMTTQEGDNVNVVAVKGNFDDCQTAVKKMFTSVEFNKLLKQNGVILSSANSINFGRLAPQIVYYFSAYCDLVNSNEIKLGDKINFVVPTGNFGNILAGYYAKKMGLPIDKLICASNSNNVLTEFFTNGSYDANREFFKTMSPSMDILISSNLERLVFEVSGRNAQLTLSRMADLKKTGKYEISKNELKEISNTFYAGFTDEDECADTIGGFFDEYGYVLDPHTSVAINVRDEYVVNSKDCKNTVVLSTASPFKFPQNVLYSINGKKVKEAFKSAETLSSISACPIPKQILELNNKEKRFNEVIDRDNIENAVKEFLDIK